MGEVKIVWDVNARQSLRKQINHIKKDSLQAADKVRTELFDIINDIPSNPKKFPKDKFKANNDGNFRAFEKHSLRIAYYIAETQIRILRVRHVKQEPKKY